jgi:hypothetical protein
VDEAGYWGSARIEQDEPWLTDEQLDLLESVDFEFVPADPCRFVSDGDTITVPSPGSTPCTWWAPMIPTFE